MRRRRWCAGRSGVSRRRGREQIGTGRRSCRRGCEPRCYLLCGAISGGQVGRDGEAPAACGTRNRLRPAPSRFRRLTATSGQAGGPVSSAGAGGARCAGSATGRFVLSHGHTSFHSCPRPGRRTSLASLLPLYRPRLPLVVSCGAVRRGFAMDRRAGTVPWHGPDVPPRGRRVPRRHQRMARGEPARGLGYAGILLDPRGAGRVQRRVDGQALRRRLDLRQLAGRVRRQGSDAPPAGRARTRSSPGSGHRCAATSSATRWWGRRSCNGAPRSRRSNSSRASSRARSRGARASASPTPAPTSPASRPGRRSTATNGSSTARRCGPPRRSTPTTSSCWRAPIPTRPSTPESPISSSRCANRGSRCGRFSRSTARPNSTRSS